MAETVDEEKERRKMARMQRKNEDKILKRMFQIMGAVSLALVMIYLIIISLGRFKYEDVDFQVVKDGNLIFYKTGVPVIYQGENRNYNFYFYNNPQKLDRKIPIVGDVEFRKNMVLNVTTEDLFCNGNWNLAIGNMRLVYNIMEINILVWNNSAEYLPEGDYMFVTFNEANVSEVRQEEENVYSLNVNDCEVLEVAERLMIETLVQFKEVND